MIASKAPLVHVRRLARIATLGQALAVLLTAAGSLAAVPAGASPQASGAGEVTGEVTGNSRGADATAWPTPEATKSEPLSPKKSSLLHFESGIKLFEDRNFSAALAEFEAAYRAYPSASSLQNIALCQKQLYRYSDAQKSLLLLLELHGSTLPSGEAKAVKDAVAELKSLVGTLRLSVSPPTAAVTLDGRTLTPEERDQAITLDVGEHRITVEADGYATYTQVVRLAGGHGELPLAVALRETTGLVRIFAPDPQTAIAIDGRPVAFANFEGRLSPGKHFVQIYRDGYEPYEEEIDVVIGETTDVKGELGDALSPEPGSGGTTTTGSKPNAVGFYGMGTFTLAAVRGHPVGFRADSNYDLGYELGLAAGYRVSPPLAFEGQLSSGSFRVQGECSSSLPPSCPFANATAYHLQTRRLSANMKLMSQGEAMRFVSSVGAGAVAQSHQMGDLEAKGFSPFVQLSLGIAFNYRHTLWELLGLGIFDGASGIRQPSYEPFDGASGIQLLGLSLRVGYSEWSPPRKLPPMPVMPERAPVSERAPVVVVKAPGSTVTSKTSGP